MKATFLRYDKPLLTAMILCPTPEECISKIRLSLADGAEAFGIQLDHLKREYRTERYLTEIFAACDGLPIYVTSYRGANSKGYSDEDCVELLLLAQKCGATLMDVIGDLYWPTSKYQLCVEQNAVCRQMKLIERIHDKGGEVLMSCHTNASLSVQENEIIANEQILRGADIIKIVNKTDNKADIPVFIESIQKIVGMTDKKLLFLVSGEGRIIRYIGPNFGVCMYLCVQSHGPNDVKEQPVLKNLKSIRDNITFDI